MPTCLAGRDPEYYEDANKVILNRKARYLSFGYGPHLCVGMHLARREMRIAIEQFLSIIPPFRLADGATVESHLGRSEEPTSELQSLMRLSSSVFFLQKNSSNI